MVQVQQKMQVYIHQVAQMKAGDISIRKECNKLELINILCFNDGIDTVICLIENILHKLC